MKIASFFKKYWIVFVLVVVAAAGLVFWQSRQKATSGSTYQTVAAAHGTLTASVGATGTVRAIQSANLTWQTNGRVDAVNGKIGDAVKADDVLATLLQTSMSQGVILAEADLVSANKSLEDLLASRTSLATAEQSLANARQAVQDAQDKVDSITFDRASDNLIMQTQANIDLAKRDVARAEDNYKLYAKKPDGDSNKSQALLTLTNARQRLTDLTNQYNWYTGKATDLDAAKFRADLAVAQAQMDDAQREVDRLKNGPSADDIAAARARVAAAQSTLDQSKIVAPFSGVLTQVEVVPGDLVSPGSLAFRVDDLSHMLVDLQISEVDINNVTVGQPVTVSFDAVQGKNYDGKVSRISQAGDSTGSGVNFTVTVELDGTDELVKPGMTAAVNITVRELSDVLLVQNRAVRQVNGKRVVYVLRDNQPVAVEIRLGATSDTNSEVVGGDLKEGDLVILNPPSTGFGPRGGGPFGG
ncbi:MAG TPA: efflux RND transporter periplasmic adaptor subunit [Anaerolineales bacterium]|jgi:HlyD family secretion protein